MISATPRDDSTSGSNLLRGTASRPWRPHHLAPIYRWTSPSPHPHVEPDHLELTLGPCQAVLYGTVRDVSGGVIVGATVEAIAVAESDASGNYALCVPLQLEGVLVSADGYALAQASPTARKRTRLDFALVPKVVIAGRVVSGAEPAAGASVFATNEGNYRLPSRTVRAEANETFRLEGLTPETYPWRVIAVAENRRASRAIVVSRPGQVEEDVVLSLDEGALLRGRVVASGAPIAGVTVILRPPRYL